MTETNRNKRNNKNGIEGCLEKSLEWYRVYETRTAINLLEPWEKCLANLIIVMVLILLVMFLFWIGKLFFGILIV